MTNMDHIAEYKSILKNVILDDAETISLLSRICICYESEIDSLSREIKASTLRIDALVNDWQAKNSEVGRLGSDNKMLLSRLDEAEDRHSRELAELRFSLGGEIVELKERLYNALLDEVSPKPVIRIAKDA